MICGSISTSCLNDRMLRGFPTCSTTWLYCHHPPPQCKQKTKLYPRFCSRSAEISKEHTSKQKQGHCLPWIATCRSVVSCTTPTYPMPAFPPRKLPSTRVSHLRNACRAASRLTSHQPTSRFAIRPACRKGKQGLRLPSAISVSKGAQEAVGTLHRFPRV